MEYGGTGSGTKTLPNKDMTICGDLRIEESAELAIGKYHLNIRGDMYMANSDGISQQVRKGKESGLSY